MLLIDQSPNVDSLLSQMELNPKALPDYTLWATGMSLLGEAVGPGTMPHKKLETIFSDLYPFFSRDLYVRAIGRLLTDIASRHGVLDKVGRALVITEVEKDGTANKIISIGSRA